MSSEEQSDPTQRKTKRVSSSTRRSKKNLNPDIVYYRMTHETPKPATNTTV
jgi:hypothetical protein